MNTMKKILSRTNKVLIEKPVIILLIAYVIFAAIFINQFASLRNISDIFTQTADLAIMACGFTFVLLNGGLDFSVTAVTGLAAVVGGLIMNTETGWITASPFGFIVGIIAMILVGVGIGCINGLAVVKLKMPSFMATMATTLVFSGLALYITKSQTIVNLPDEYIFLGRGAMPFIIALVVVVVMHYVLSHTVFGRKIYAVGTNPHTSKTSGIPVNKIIFKLFVLSGFCAAIAAIVMSARIGADKPSLGADSLMDVVAAVVIGGTSIFGGEGTMLGTLAGAFFITIINSSLSLASLPWYFVIITKGAVLFAVAIFYAVRKLKSN